jgi:hypothetical protein
MWNGTVGGFRAAQARAIRRPPVVVNDDILTIARAAASAANRLRPSPGTSPAQPPSPRDDGRRRSPGLPEERSVAPGGQAPSPLLKTPPRTGTRRKSCPGRQPTVAQRPEPGADGRVKVSRP